MRAQKIRGQLIQSGSSYAALARKIGVSDVAVLYTATRRSKSLRIAQAIADQIKKPLLKVFPEYKGLKPSKNNRSKL